MVNGKAFKPTEWSSSGTPIVRIQNLNNPGASFNYCDFEVPEKFYIRNGEFLISWSGTPGTSFGAFIWQGELAVLNQHIFRCELYGGFLDQYLRLAVNAQLDEMIARAHGAVGLRHITKGKLEHMLITLPPLAEQKRIVAKVDELMKRCDELEVRQKERNERRTALTASCLHALTACARMEGEAVPGRSLDPNRSLEGEPVVSRHRASGAAQLRPPEYGSAQLRPPMPGANPHAWNRICSHVQLLIDTPESVAELRKTILQLAVQGRLVPACARGELQTVGDSVGFLNGYAFKSEWFKSDGIRLCRNVNVGHGILDWRDVAFVAEALGGEFSRFALAEGDIVLSLDRPIITTGLKVARVRKQDLPCLLLQRVAKPVPKHDQLDLDYLLLWLKSPQFIDSIDPGRSNGVPHISTRQVQSLPFVLPPLAEQKRIVAKVNELMALCDDLEAQLTQSRQEAEKLVGAVVRHCAV
jgi:type I restriction enzyme S subunit